MLFKFGTEEGIPITRPSVDRSRDQGRNGRVKQARLSESSRKFSGKGQEEPGT